MLESEHFGAWKYSPDTRFWVQGGIKTALEGKAATKTKGRIDKVARALQVPLTAMCAAQDDEYRKTKACMWEHHTEKCNKSIAVDKTLSFFVGDAAGRPDDFADLDKV